MSAFVNKRWPCFLTIQHPAKEGLKQVWAVIRKSAILSLPFSIQPKKDWNWKRQVSRKESIWSYHSASSQRRIETPFLHLLCTELIYLPFSIQPKKDWNGLPKNSISKQSQLTIQHPAKEGLKPPKTLIVSGLCKTYHSASSQRRIETWTCTWSTTVLLDLPFSIQPKKDWNTYMSFGWKYWIETYHSASSQRRIETLWLYLCPDRRTHLTIQHPAKEGLKPSFRTCYAPS